MLFRSGFASTAVLAAQYDTSTPFHLAAGGALSVARSVLRPLNQHSCKGVLVRRAALVAGNQAAAKLMHPLVNRHYPWSCDAGVLRRATETAPLGLFALGEQANRAVVTRLR